MMNMKTKVIMMMMRESFISLLLIVCMTAWSSTTSCQGFVPTHDSTLRAATLSTSRHGAFQQKQRYQSIISTSVQLHSTVVSQQSTSVTTNDKREGDNVIGTIMFILPSSSDEDQKQSSQRSSRFGVHSPVKPPSYKDAATHLAKKAFWFSEGRTETYFVMPSDSSIGDDAQIQQRKKLLDADIVIALGLSTPTDLEYASTIFQQRSDQLYDDRFHKCHFALDCGGLSSSSSKLSAMVGPYIHDGRPRLLPKIAPWTDAASAKRFYDQMTGLFDRWTSDDFTVALMLFLNRFSGSSVNWVKDSADATWEKGPVRNVKEFYGMATKCGDCLANCLQDETCKKCLETLTELDTRDQAASYRTIVSYESEELEKFSFCVFQKHNIFQCNANIPTIPKVEPMAKWRGTDLTLEAARSLLVGHLDDDAAPVGSTKTDISWKVACGANVAYDQFPSQNQIFYEAAKGKDMWYDPVFRVQTLDGRNIWCKRHYRVRNGPRPGTFRLSVLDNGVTSNEFWTILGAADDLSWIAFHYAGAASSVGQHYIGGLLCTADGTLPPESVRQEIWNVFKMAGIEPWELFVVNNNPDDPGLIDAGPPPLDFYRKGVLEMKAQIQSS